LLALLGIGAGLDLATGWIDGAFDFVAHQFYEIPLLAEIRRPSQLGLTRAHLLVCAALAASGLFAARWLSGNARSFWAIFVVAYAIRAVIWIAGGNLPLVPGDSCHYLEVATSVYRGEGPVKHYVESFFIDYPPIRENRGVLDDWATPLYAYVLAGAYRVTGIVPGESIESTVAVAKGTSFLLNLLTLPALYAFARRRFSANTALVATAILAALPVHALYAGFALRESLVALTSVLAIWFLTECWAAEGARAWAWAILAGFLGGLAILSRNTAEALLAGAGLYGVIAHGRKKLSLMIVWGLVVVATIAPWAYATYVEYGEPFFTYTKYFPYNFSWTVHHYEKGNTKASEFYTAANAASIVRIKIKSLLIIATYSTMIIGLPVMAAFFWRLRRAAVDATESARDVDCVAAVMAAAFVAATLVSVADVTQVAQLGRYYLPLFVLMLPTAAAGLRDWASNNVAPRAWSVMALSLFALLWADPTWAYDATWFVKPYQLHWPALRKAGEWVREHPAEVPQDARIMTWFPWEFRIASQHTTVLLPRSLHPSHIRRTIDQYQPTHILWGSFEPPPHIDPETYGPYLERLRISLGLTDDREIYRTPKTPGRPDYFPVRLFKLR
jgi:4-amino-4-deoxy-L-arabinose transferase-like glycosyltransferase